MAESRAILKIDDLYAGYGAGEVLSGVSFSICEGETAALLGLNGSGKSTLLRAAMGLQDVHRGDTAVDGESVYAMTQRRRAKTISYIPQRSRLDEGVTVLEAVLMGANAQTPLLFSYSAAQRRRARVCLEQLGMQSLENRMIGTLSQGQRKLAVFARAMMQQAKVFLLDEPDGALDLPRRYEIMGHVRRMAQADGCCALAALHDASLALSLCDRVLILKEGRIACALDMRAAQEADVLAAMRLLYGDVKVCRAENRWAVLG